MCTSKCVFCESIQKGKYDLPDHTEEKHINFGGGIIYYSIIKNTIACVGHNSVTE